MYHKLKSIVKQLNIMGTHLILHIITLLDKILRLLTNSTIYLYNQIVFYVR